jgi:hypothetical protein
MSDVFWFWSFLISVGLLVWYLLPEKSFYDKKVFSGGRRK